MRHYRILLIPVLALLALGATSCGPMVTKSFSSDAQGAGTVRAEFGVSVADVMVSPGAPSGLVDARFEYNIPELEPAANYSVSDGVGLLSVRHPSGSISTPVGTRSVWDVRLNPNVPLDLDISAGVGDCRLHLGSLLLTGLNLKAGVGDVLVDFTGFGRQSLVGSIKAGVGGFTLRIPRNVGARVRATSGVGDIDARGGWYVSGGTYTNPAWGTAAVSLDLAVAVGVGGVELVLQ